MKSKPRKTRIVRKSRKHLKVEKKSLLNKYLILFLLVLISCATIGGFVWHGKIVEQKRLDLAEKRLEMTRIPKEIKKSLLQTATPSATFSIPILMYHYVEFVADRRDTIRQSLDIIPPILEKQIETLKNADYTFLTMNDVADIMDGKKPAPKNPIVFTFDDGYRDFYTDVFPIVKKENVKVVSFVVPGFLDKPNFLLTSQLLEIAKSDLVEIAAHTMHHIYLKRAAANVARVEIAESKSELETLLNRPVVSFAYPYGAFDQQAIDFVKAAGFKTAVSTIPGKEESESNRFFIYRLRPGARVGDTLLRFLQQTQFKPW